MRPEPPPTALASWPDALANGGDVGWVTMPHEGLDWLPARAGVVVVDPEWRLPDRTWAADRSAALDRWVQDGGRLVLFGHAARLAASAGFEREAPESSVFRWGFDGRARSGHAQLGFDVVSGREPALFDGVPADANVPERHWLAGDTPCTAPLCTWSIGAPRDGEVLARLCVSRDGDVEPAGAPVLVRWQVGKGAVLACGLLPQLDHEDAAVRDAAAAFVRRCVKWASGARGAIVCSEAPRAKIAPVAAAVDEPPLAPRVPHWGWQLALHSGGEALPPDDVLRDALLPSWLAGADLCEIELADAAGAAPLAWASGDPLKPAPSFRGAGERAPWQRQSLLELSAEAHARGMLVLGAIDPSIVAASTTERLVALRFLARELACVRRHDGASFDGFGVRSWLDDASGYSAAMLQDFQPAALLYRVGERAPALAGGARAIDADDGAPRGATFAGLAAQWRDGFPADVFPFGVLDARAVSDGRSVVAGGGSHGDWIAAQANHFVRERAGRGGAMWWRRHDPATLDADTAEYVHGVSSEPLSAAVATSLAATGRGGVRDAAASLLDGAPTGFGAMTEAPAAVHALQNNWFQLLGSGGRLCFDARGLARFPSGATVVSPGFLRTRLFGTRPDGDSMHGEQVDLLAGSEPLTAVLAHDGSDGAPSHAWFEWDAAAGCHELELVPRAVTGSGILTIALDGVLLRAVPFREGGAADEFTVPVHVASAGLRELQFAVLQGGRVALDRAVLRRTGDVAVEASVVAPAGSRAVLLERSSSSHHAERVELTAVADVPGFVLHVTNERAAKQLQAERTFALPEHRVLAAVTAGERPDRLRQPFVLRSARSDQPDVVIAPLRLSRYEHCRFDAGSVVWHSAPETGMQSRIGVLLCAHGDGERWLPHATALLTGVAEPLRIELGASGETNVLQEVAVPSTRVLHVIDAPPTPFFVGEGGWWQWRSSQPAPGGGRWLRVHQTPGEAVRIVAGPAVLARTRPGPGSLRLLALKDPEPLAATVRVLQPSLLGPPSIVMAADFDDVRIDGEPWRWFRGRTVYLPNRTGTFRVETRRLGGDVPPHVASVGAPLVVCQWSPTERELLLVTPGAPGRPAELPWTAVLAGPAPRWVENGEVVDDATLRLPDAAAAARARAGGTLIRFRSGVTRVHYGD